MPRQRIYTLLIVVSAALMLGRILAVDRVDVRQLQTWKLAKIAETLTDKEARLRQVSANEQNIRAELDATREKLLADAMYESPMLSGNDRSRWCTIRALVEPDMRVVRTVTMKDGTEKREFVWYAIDKVQNLKGWDTIDMVKHDLPDRPGPEYLYSSKPPLLPSVLAIPYAVLYRGSGQRISFESDPYLIVRTTLVLTQLLPLLLGWALLVRLIERFGTTDWGRIFSVAFLCFGTFLSTFVVTLNNHLPAVFCVTVAFYCGLRILLDGETRLRYYVAAGLFASFAVACELPALSFGAVLAILLLLRFPVRTLLAAGSGAAVVAAGFFATNYMAHQTVLPAYSQRDWYYYEYERGGVLRDSYWKNPVGIDRGEPLRSTYAFHAAVGHHGLFSLTPVWLLSFIGLGIWLIRPPRTAAVKHRGAEHGLANREPGDTTSDDAIRPPPSPDATLRITALTILVVSLVVFAFYMMMEQGNRNYGGMTSALRWMFWLTPLWSVPLVSAADRLGRNGFGRAFCLILLLASVASAAYPTWNPWSQPWPYYLMVYLGLPVI